LEQRRPPGDDTLRRVRRHDADDRERGREHRERRALHDRVAVAERRLRECRDSRDDEERADETRNDRVGIPIAPARRSGTAMFAPTIVR